MKRKINPFLYRLIKVYIIYIVSTVFLFILIIAELRIGADQNSISNIKIQSLSNDIKKLEAKANLLTSIIPSAERLDEDIKLLNMLIPNIEDYFSIAYSLERLSQQTNFNVTGYTINVKESKSNKLRLTVNGVGDSESFMTFLNNYNFVGGRLITSDRIELNPQEIGIIRIELTFYNKNAQGSENLSLPTSGALFDEIEEIKKKVSFSFTEETDVEQTDFDYEKKSNPF